MPCISKQQTADSNKKKEIDGDNEKKLMEIFDCCENILRDGEGLVCEKALKTLSYLIILKTIEPLIGKEIDFISCDYPFNDDMSQDDKHFLISITSFSKLSVINEDNIINNTEGLWDYILSEHPSTKKIFCKGQGFNITNKSTFTKLFKKLVEIDKIFTSEEDTNVFVNLDYDILGNSYEQFIRNRFTGRNLGQFFTQPAVKKMMVKLIDPQVFSDGKIESCGDPTMGTGGFLISYLKHVSEQAKLKNIKLDMNFIKNEGLYGKEIEPDTFQLAVSNMLISTGHMFETLERGDSIRKPITHKFDNILANPPYGIKGLNYDDINSPIKQEYVPIKTENAVSLFIQAIIYMLKINGKCAVVLPDGQDLFSKTNKTLVSIREYLMKTCDLKEIIYLPSGVFSYTNIKTCVFFFIKKKEGTQVLETKITYTKPKKEGEEVKEKSRDYKLSKTHQTHKVKFFDYNPYEEVKNLLVEVPIEQIAKNSYSLNYAEYIKDESNKEENNSNEDINDYDTKIMKLEEICKFDIGGTPSRNKNEYYENGNNLWVSVRELNGGYIYDTKEKITDLGVEKSSVKLFAKDTILFSFKLSIGKTAIAGNPMYSNEAIAGILSKNEMLLNNKYLYYYLTINDFTKLGSGIFSNGSLNKKSLGQIKIPIPPLERQQKIVEYLDFIYEQSIKTSSEKILQLKKLNECYLNNQKIFGKNEIKTLGEVCEIKSGNHSTKKCDFVEGEYLIIGGGKQPIGKHNEYNCDENTILCASHGTAGYISMYPIKTFLTMAFAFVENKKLINKMYLFYYLKSIEEHLISLGKGTAQPCISMGKLKSIKIPVPPLEKQQEIVAYCESNENLINNLEKEIEQNKKAAELFIKNVLKSKMIDDDDNNINNEHFDEESITEYSEENSVEEIVSSMEKLDIQEEVLEMKIPRKRYLKKNL